MVVALVACGDRGSRPPAAARDARSDDAGNSAQNQTTTITGKTPAWLVELEQVAPRPELVAHAPVVVGKVVIVAGSRVDYRGLALENGAEAWHRPGGATLSAPAVMQPTDVVLVHECDVAVGAPPGRAVLACFDRIDPIAIAARSAGRIHVDEDKLGDCTSGGGAWRVLNTNPRSLGLMRGHCLFDSNLDRGEATRLYDPPGEPPLPDDVVFKIEGERWRQAIANGKSSVVRDDGPSLEGLTVLAAAHTGTRGAVVVRRDSSLANDYLAAYDGTTILWTWPLPAPPDPAGRAGPIGIAVDDASVLVFFDASRVARFTTPWARPTAP